MLHPWGLKDSDTTEPLNHNRNSSFLAEEAVSAWRGDVNKKGNHLSEKKIFLGKHLMGSDNFRTRKRTLEILSLGQSISTCNVHRDHLGILFKCSGFQGWGLESYISNLLPGKDHTLISKRKCSSLIRVRLFATPRTIAHQAPLFMGFSR